MTEITSAVEEIETAAPRVPRLTVTDITFRDGLLFKPRYESLFAYAPEVEAFQFEPAFQIIAPPGDLEIEALFEIRADQAVRFLEDEEKPGSVRCRAIDDPNKPDVPGLVSASFDGERRCRLLWSRSALDKKVTTVRIFCEREAGRPEDPETWVEGGLYLSIIDRPKKPEAFEAAYRPSPRETATIKIAGVDALGRPMYDLFLPLPEDFPTVLELEPAIRCREGDEHHLLVALALPAPYSDLVFKTEAPGKARVFPERPPKLTRASTQPGDKVCELTWTQGKDRYFCKPGSPYAPTPPCAHGTATSFFFKTTIETGSRAPKHVHRLSEELDIDPTVIQPPVCNGDICIPPPNDPGSGAGD